MRNNVGIVLCSMMLGMVGAACSTGGGSGGHYSYAMPTACDATGTWSMNLIWGAGNCQFTAPLVVTMDVDPDHANSYEFVIVGYAAAGSVTDNGGACVLNVTANGSFVDPQVGPYTVSYTFHVNDGGADAIAGSGNVSFGGGYQCQQQFVVTGGVQ